MERTIEAARVDTIRRAYRIAVRDLRACYNPDGIVAGRLHFNAYWARDGFWALLGALALGDYDQAASQLTTFVRFQYASGRLPIRLEFVGHTFGNYNTLRARPKVIARAGGLFTDPIDPAALFIIAAREYLERTGDTSFSERFDPFMDRAAGWLMRHDRDGDGIIESHFLADWMDSILKRGKIFNLNVIYYVGLRACEALKVAVGQADRAEEFRRIAERVYDRLQTAFWTGDYFADWVRGSRRGGFSADGNVCAVFFGAATEAQARRILGYIAAQGLDTATPLVTCHPVYPSWQVFPLYFLAGIPDYHRTLIWPWLGTLNAVNKYRLGDRDGALADLSRIGEWYIRSNAVNEVYERTGTPVARFFYHAEVPFAWNAGVYIHAVHAVGCAGPPLSGPGLSRSKGSNPVVGQ
jgi:glycogen debranching enzyme